MEIGKKLFEKKEILNEEVFEDREKGIEIEIEGKPYFNNDNFEFDENFERIGKSDSDFFYVDYGNIKGIPELEDMIIISHKNTRDDLINYLYDNEVYNSNDDLTRMSVEPLAKDVLDDLSYTYGSDITESNIEYIIDELYNYGIKAEINPRFEWIDSRGYSQGDYANILVDYDQIKKAWGTVPSDRDLQKTFDRLFWDSPINGVLTIKQDKGDSNYGEELFKNLPKTDINEEYYYDEMLSDSYEWDRDEVIEYILKYTKVSNKDLLEEYLEEFIPSEPDYN